MSNRYQGTDFDVTLGETMTVLNVPGEMPKSGSGTIFREMSDVMSIPV